MTTLETIRGRCVIDGETGCWKWSGAMNRDAKGGRVPIVWHGERARSAIRVAYELGRGPVQPGAIVWRTCGCESCLNPAHLMAGTRAQWGAWRSETGRAAPTPQWRAQNHQNARARGVLSLESARYIRTSDKTGKALAVELGVSKTAVSRVRLGRTWNEAVHGASVFAWRP